MFRRIRDMWNRKRGKVAEVKAVAANQNVVLSNVTRTTTGSGSSSSADDSFTTSLLTGMATNNMALGTLYGGNMTGALVGDLMRDGSIGERDSEAPCPRQEGMATTSSSSASASSTDSDIYSSGCRRDDAGYSSDSDSYSSSCSDSSSSDSCSSGSDW